MKDVTVYMTPSAIKEVVSLYRPDTPISVSNNIRVTLEMIKSYNQSKSFQYNNQ